MNNRGFVLGLALSAGFAAAQPTIRGDQIVGRDGLSLYVFENDIAGSGKSVCQGACLNVFPAYVATPEDKEFGDFTIIERPEGTRQWAYAGRPLYKFYADEARGQQGGEGLNRNTWHTARPRQ